MKARVLLFVCCFVVCALAGTAPLVLFTQDEVNTYGARCLDGSPSGYYLYKSQTPAYATKWLIWLEGGGWCFPNSTYPNVQNCYDRITSYLGSSKYWASSMNVGFFRDYNYVFIQYCGGDFHSGTRTNPVGGLYYAGHLTIKATIAKLKQQSGLGNASLVILNGGSAGGLGTLVNFDYVQSQFTNAEFKAWPASGWFPDFVPPAVTGFISMSESYKVLYDQTSAYLNQKCVAANPSSPWVCYAGYNVYPLAYKTTPILVSQALFDNWAQGFNGVQNISSPAGIKYMSHYGQAMRNTISQALQGPASIGLFFTEQNVHEFGGGVTVNGVSLQTVAEDWLDGTSGPVKEVSSCNYLNCQAISYQGCYLDSTKERDMPVAGPQSDSQTIENCQTFCKSKNYQYAGLQNGTDCWCGNSFGKYGSYPSSCNIGWQRKL